MYIWLLNHKIARFRAIQISYSSVNEVLRRASRVVERLYLCQKWTGRKRRHHNCGLDDATGVWNSEPPDIDFSVDIFAFDPMSDDDISY